MSAPVRSFELLETMAHLPGAGLRNLDGHLARLSVSADYFGFPLDLEHVRAKLHRCGAGLRRPKRVRLTVRSTGAVTVEHGPMPAAQRGPVRLATDPEPVPSRSIWLFHKTTRREAYDIRRGRHAYADDVILVNERGQLTETTIANLAVRLDGTWFTPPVESGCLPGVERGRLLREGHLTERILHVADLRVSEGLALVSSLRGRRRASFVSSPGFPAACLPVNGHHGDH